MKYCLLLAAVCGGIVTFEAASADENVDDNPFDNPNYFSKGTNNPDHLEPIKPYSENGYEQRLFRHLVGSDLGELWMVTTGTGRESAIILRQSRNASGTHTWSLEFHKVGSPIEKGGRDALEFGQKAIHRKVIVSSHFAATLSEAWQTVLVKTRYAKEEYRGLDGADFWFYCKPKYYGTTWTPSSGQPYLLVTLGHRLMDLANAPETEAAKLTKECDDISKKIVAGAKVGGGRGGPLGGAK